LKDGRSKNGSSRRYKWERSEKKDITGEKLGVVGIKRDQKNDPSTKLEHHEITRSGRAEDIRGREDLIKPASIGTPRGAFREKKTKRCRSTKLSRPDKKKKNGGGVAGGGVKVGPEGEGRENSRSHGAKDHG